MGNPAGVDSVLEHIPNHIFTDWLLAGTELLDDRALVHPLGNGDVAIFASYIHSESPAYNDCQSGIDIETSRPLGRCLDYSDEVIAQRRYTAVELAVDYSLTFAPFRLTAQVPGIKGREDG